MLDLVSDIWGSQVIIEAFGVVLDDDFAFSLALVLSFDVLFFDVFVKKGFDEGVKLFLLVIACRAAGVYKNTRTHDSCENLGFLITVFIDIKNDE